MSIGTDLVQKALHLPVAERADIARQLIISLDSSEADTGVGKAWETEIESRLLAVGRGDVKLKDWKKSVERIRKTLNRDNHG